MNGDRFSETATRSWARFVWSQATGISQASGDCERLLGIQARALVESPDPVRLLPPGLSAALESAIPETPTLAGLGSLLFTLDPSPGGTVVTVFEPVEARTRGGSILEDIGTGVIGVDASGIIRLWNNAMTSIIPVKSEAALGRPIESLVPAPLLFAWNGVMNAVADGRIIRAELRPGVQRRVEAVFSPGGPGMIGVFLDTSDGFEAERRLRSARRMNQTYFQSISSGLVMLGSDLRILVSNRAFGRIFGVREGLPGMPVYEVLPPESFASLDQAVRRIQSGELEVPSSSVVFCMPGGERKVVSQTFRPVRSEDDENLHIVGIFEDISDRFALAETVERNAGKTGRMLELVDGLGHAEPSAIPDLVVSSMVEIAGALAAALFRPDRHGAGRLAASFGDWSFVLPDDFLELRIPRSAWGGSQGLCLRADEIRQGVEADLCLDVIPIGSGQLERGFLVLLFDSQEAAQTFLAEAAIPAFLIGSSLDAGVRAARTAQIETLLDKERRFSSDLLGGIGIPAAVFGEDWRVLMWNREMSDITGLDAESARKRPGAVIELLFGPMGGIAEARKLASAPYSPPVTWAVRHPDGTVTECSWRICRSELAEKDSTESVSILSGVRLGGQQEERLEGRRHEDAMLLAGAVSRLSYAASPRQFASALADFAAAVTGASGATAVLPMHEGVMEARAGRAREDRTISIPVPSADGLPSGPARLDLTGDASRRSLEMIGSIASGALSGSLACSLGRGLLDCGAPPDATTVLFSDEGGMVTSPGLVNGVWVEGGVHVARLLRIPTEAALDAMRSASRLGVVSIGAGPGTGPAIRVSPYHAGNPRFVWHSDPGAMHPDSTIWLKAMRDLSAWLPSRVREARGRLSALSHVLGRENPVRPALMALLLDMSSLARVSAHLGFLGRALMASPARVPASDVIGLVVQKCIGKGRRPPDLDMGSGPPVVRVDAELISDLIEASMSAGGPGSAPAIRVGMMQGGKADGSYTHHGPGGQAVFEILWDRPIVPLIPQEEAVELAAGGTMSASAELAMVAIAAGLAGCIFEADANGIRIVTPASQDGESWEPDA